jgi:hypothetical protein
MNLNDDVAVDVTELDRDWPAALALLQQATYHRAVEWDLLTQMESILGVELEGSNRIIDTLAGIMGPATLAEAERVIDMSEARHVLSRIIPPDDPELPTREDPGDRMWTRAGNLKLYGVWTAIEHIPPWQKEFGSPSPVAQFETQAEAEEFVRALITRPDKS